MSYTIRDIYESKNIFLYWDKGEKNIPLIHLMNINNIRKRLKNTGWKVIVTSLVKESEFYVGKLIDLPGYFFDIKNKIIDYSSISGNQSDIIRLRLLEKYGGVYFDTSTILLKNTIEEIKLYDLLMRTKKSNVAGYTNVTFTRKNQDKTNYFKNAKDGLELGVLYAKKDSVLLKVLNNEIDRYWLWKTKNKDYRDYPLFKKTKLKSVSFLNEYHIHYTLFHMIITREESLLDNLVTQSMHMKGKENSKVDGPYSISDRFCRGVNGYGNADSKKLLNALIKGKVRMFNGTNTTLMDRISLFLEADLFVIPGYMRVELEKNFNNIESYNNVETAYQYFYRQE